MVTCLPIIGNLYDTITVASHLKQVLIPQSTAVGRLLETVAASLTRNIKGRTCANIVESENTRKGILCSYTKLITMRCRKLKPAPTVNATSLKWYYDQKRILFSLWISKLC